MLRRRLVIALVPLLFLNAVPLTGCSTDECCRRCRTGKACGDSCIAEDATCHVGDGCACNG